MDVQVLDGVVFVVCRDKFLAVANSCCMSSDVIEASWWGDLEINFRMMSLNTFTFTVRGHGE